MHRIMMASAFLTGIGMAITGALSTTTAGITAMIETSIMAVMIAMITTTIITKGICGVPAAARLVRGPRRVAVKILAYWL